MRPTLVSSWEKASGRSCDNQVYSGVGENVGTLAGVIQHKHEDTRTLDVEDYVACGGGGGE